ncbi:SusC/RagA family TonB-linked outer membrane protein [Olivibacter domesticus]|uniref:TonB-linked outer membrane protein, SusC/RagA family n=1 Tax=Olivibacter domesticus TaxID=407022 RepID=A0A1H7MML7_OLID1|nr:SusC/RagA family TonB-linked outer membrane protein [Olivibacter domesticus]SEL12108.1 TonB-linked outer membrane protein, SusC/RagA family [Olivibacter domesticus]
MKNYANALALLKKCKKLICVLWLLLGLQGVFLLGHALEKQSLSETLISLNETNKPLKDILNTFGEKSGLRMIYNEKLIKKYQQLSIKEEKQRLSVVLDHLLANTELDYELRKESVIILEKESPSQGPITVDKPLAKLQDRQIKGIVTDETGLSLPGVSVKIKDTARGTVTDSQGNFALDVSNDTTVLVFSYMGFLTQEMPLTTETMLRIKLKSVDNELDEVVVIGYGTQRKGDLTSSVATVKSEDFLKGSVRDAGQLIQGKVAGLTITNPSGDPTANTQVLLRGNTTILGANSNPLVLIDGVPGSFNTVAPEDIESVDVLKDGSAAAIYGTRGTNGVILITTKKAKGNDLNQVDYSAYASTSQIIRRLDMLTAADYRDQIAAGTRDASWDLGASTNWLNEITRTPISHVHNLTFKGGNGKTNYIANLNYRALQGIFKRSNNNVFQGRIEINHSMFDDKLKFNIGIIGNQTSYTATGDGYGFNSYVYRQALIRNPTAPIYDAEGNWQEQTGLFEYENPLSRLYESDGKQDSTEMRYNGNISYNPIKDLKLNALFSYVKSQQNGGYYETKNHISTLRDGRNGFAAVSSNANTSKLMELTAQYSKDINDHSFNLLGGYSYQETDYTFQRMTNWDFPTDNFSYHNISTGRALKEGLTEERTIRRTTNLIGFFGRLTYSYKDKYLLLASLRHEAASQLYGTRKPWGTFPAISLGWRLSKEAFMENQHLFDDLKLRAGYGVTGSQPNASFLGVALLNYSDYFYSNGTWIQIITPAQNSNEYLRWEEKHETNIGLDFSMLNSRITGSIDVYNRDINGLLYDYAVPSPPNLYTTTRANVGKMRNRGVEVLLSFNPIRKKDFNWTTSVNFSTNSNKLISLSNELYQSSSDYFMTGWISEPVKTESHIVRVGDKIGNFYGFKVIDIADDGKWIYEDKDGNAVAYDDFSRAFQDKKVIGNGLPRWYAGWNHSFQYKQFDLNISMRGAFGYQIINGARMYYENTNLEQYNRLKSAYDKIYGKAVLNSLVPGEFNSYYVENGNHWKIDNITLGYTFNSKKWKNVKALRLYASSLNTFIITGYKGIDPEVNRSGLNPGYDNRDQYPSIRSFTIGANVSF